MKHFILATILLFFTAVSPVWADHNGVRNEDPRHNSGGASQEGLSFSVESHLQFGSIEGLIVGILNILLVLSVPIIVFFLIFAGFNYVTAQGNPEKIKTASRSLTYALIGGVLILGAVALSEVIRGIVASLQ